MGKRLLIIGAGPKALAVAAKATVLQEQGFDVPEIVIIERHETAANWTGKFGYTDGNQPLGTPAEKDVGFPYASKTFGHQADFAMLQKFSWQAYNIDRWGSHPEAIDTYAEDVDRGVTRQPQHSHWAQYLRWVSERVSGARIVKGEVIRIVAKGERWQLRCRTGEGDREVEGDGLLITGPGPALCLPGQPRHARVLDGQTFWQVLDRFASVPLDEEPIGVIGSGETAASVVIGLAKTLRRAVPIIVANRQGAVFSRGEGFWENRLYSDPEGWDLLSPEERRHIINRTDRGVFSVAAMAFVNQLRNVIHKRMDVVSIDIATQFEHEDEGRPVIVDRSGLRLPVQYAVVAIGFDPWWFVPLFEDATLRALMLHHDTREILIENVGTDLSFPDDRVPTPKLHVPMLAGLRQGPGFPNLSCLGHLADRILSAYIPESTRTRASY